MLAAIAAAASRRRSPSRPQSIGGWGSDVAARSARARAAGARRPAPRRRAPAPRPRRRGARRAATRRRSTSSSWWCRRRRCRSRRRWRRRRSPRGSRCGPAGTRSAPSSPPISAAAMLSRNDDSTKTIASSAKRPSSRPGSTRGSASGTSLSSKCRDSSANPSSRHAEVGDDHPLVRRGARPARTGPGPRGNGEPEHLVDGDDDEARDGDAQRVMMEERDPEQGQTRRARSRWESRARGLLTECRRGGKCAIIRMQDRGRS